VRARVGLGMSFASRNALDHVWRVKTQFYFVSPIRLLSEKSQGKLPSRPKKIHKRWLWKNGKRPDSSQKWKKQFPAMPKRAHSQKRKVPAFLGGLENSTLKIRHRNTLETFQQNLYAFKVPSKYTSKFGWVPQGSQRKKELRGNILGGQHYNLRDGLR